jgi:very-short-patch-repair endonuclease
MSCEIRRTGGMFYFTPSTTTADIIQAAKLALDIGYDYSKLQFVSRDVGFIVGCPVCGKWFNTKADIIFAGFGCSFCKDFIGSLESRKRNFITKAKQRHAIFENGNWIDKYDYSKVNYIGSHTNVEIICLKCGKSLIHSPANHLLGRGCPKCYKSNKSSIEEFIYRASNIHVDRYDYSKVNYIDMRTKIEIVCLICKNSFFQTPDNHLHGRGCPRYCYINKTLAEEFIYKASKLHMDKYDYSRVNYINSKIKVEIVCLRCRNSFFQAPFNHLLGCGCPKCCMSKGESLVIQCLNFYGVMYTCQKTFQNLYDENVLKFDFFIPSINLLIEFDGEQHYKCIEHFGGVNTFEKNKKHDNMKDHYALTSGLSLVRIAFEQINNINMILRDTINRIMNGNRIIDVSISTRFNSDELKKYNLYEITHCPSSHGYQYMYTSKM